MTKETIIAIVLILLSIHVFSQARLNSTASEIREEFSDAQYNLTSGFDDDGDYYISLKTEHSNVIHYFNDNYLCYVTIIIPNDQGALNMFVELYNSRYVIISDVKWKMYTSTGLADIELIFGENGGYYFLWTISG